MSLTEIDMIAQMKEADFFIGIQDERLLLKLDMMIQGVQRLRTIRYLYSKTIMNQNYINK